MNSLQPNLNTTPISPATLSIPSFQAVPLPSDQSAQPSFTQTLANQVQSNQNSQNTPSAPNVPSAPSTQNAPSAPNVPSAQNNQSTDNAQSTQDAQNSQASTSSTAAPATAKTADKTADKTKTDKQTADASAADKTSSDLLALVAASQAKVTPQQQAAATQALPVAVPLTAQLVANGGKGGGKGAGANDAIDVNGKSSKTTLPDAWNAKAGADGKTPATDSITPADTNAANNPAALGQTAVKDVASGKADATAAQAVAAAGANAAPAALNAKAGPDLQTLSTTATAPNNNAMFNPALQVAGTAPQSAAAAAAGDKLTPAVGTTDWNSALGQKVVWMSSNGQQSATLTLNPRDLGPMQVTINVTKNQADATFIAANPEVKQALEAAMPKLREMMDQAGIQLGQANVSTGMPNQNQQAFNQPQSSSNSGSRGGNGSNGGGQSDGGIALSSVAITPAAGSSSGQGLVDTFV
ncbi:MAG TPA: flagellar hook-length control protein FliK [Herbaspirillum sp.]|nr:flagellar hook-length control protein FliK [Herbaspirillum sp.]